MRPRRKRGGQPVRRRGASCRGSIYHGPSRMHSHQPHVRDPTSQAGGVQAVCGKGSARTPREESTGAGVVPEPRPQVAKMQAGQRQQQSEGRQGSGPTKGGGAGRRTVLKEAVRQSTAAHRAREGEPAGNRMESRPERGHSEGEEEGR